MKVLMDTFGIAPGSFVEIFMDTYGMSKFHNEIY